MSLVATPTRIVHQGDGLAYLARGQLPADHAVFTSLPDRMELPLLGFAGWRTWFIDAVALTCRALADHAVAVFYQTDVVHDGRWIDKGHLVMLGAEAAGSALVWHKLVCRVPPGNASFGRPGYAHLVCVSRERRLDLAESTPDVLPALGTMSWSRAMGSAACDAAIRYIATTGARTVVDPFCGQGSALAAANAHGLDAFGIEISRRRVAKARNATHST